MRRLLVPPLVVLGIALLGGCGEEDEVASGATVTAYVEAPLCAGAQRALARRGGEVGALRLRAVCLPAHSRGGRLDLAVLGANARRAAEDSTAVAYLAASDRAAARFSGPILTAAGIGTVETESGAVAIGRVAVALTSGDGAPREAVREGLRGPRSGPGA